MSWIIAVSAVGLLAVAYSACYVLFRLTIIKKKRNIFGKARTVKDRRNSKLGNFNRSGYEWTEKQPHEEVLIKSFDSLSLYARLYLHNNRGNYNYIILFHGYRSSARRDFGGLVTEYYNRGWNVLLADQRSHGKSGGKYITLGSLERFDVICWAEYLTDRFGGHISVVLGGMSMGATSVLGAAGLNLPATVKGIIADCGFTSPKEIITHVGKKDFYRLPVNKALAFRIIELQCRLRGFSLQSPPVYEAIKNNSLPVLFIHGKADKFVPPEMSVRCYNEAECEKNILLIEGAAHAESAAEDTDRYLNAVFAFLEKIIEKEKEKTVCLPR
ncbi:MAG: alpha/beta hydrolase [Eubacteriales bacterium]|nr:alpha/beta hydrolase [Eubacteriales bacterium]